MIASTTHKFIFIHIPKTAGGSIKHALHKHIDISTREKDWLEKLSPHPTINKLKEHFNLDDYFKFAFVRNPWDRLVSYYYFIQRADIYLNDHNHKWYEQCKEIVKACPTFESYVNSDYCEIDSQCSFITDEKVCLDYIGRFENLQNDLNEICDRIGIDRCVLSDDADSQIIKKSNRGVYQSYYNNRTRHRVGEIFKKDIELFNYKF
jgi:chondroitin 4-sulfotransferase 11